MNQKSKTAIFFGSGPVAAASLTLLLKHQPIEAVITKPSTKNQMEQAVGGAAPVHCAQTSQQVHELLQQLKPASQIGILIDFGIIISQSVIDQFELGVVNSHFSLLPELRGPDPITFAILSGQSQTGVSLMLLVQAMDEGPILAMAEHTITPSCTTPQLTDELVVLSDSLLQQYLPSYQDGQLTPTSQSDPALRQNRTPTYTHKLQKTDGEINWSKSATTIEREVRAYSGWPKSYTKLGIKDVIVTTCHVVVDTSFIPANQPPGTIHATKSDIFIACGDGSILAIDNLKPAGKPAMSAQSYLAGYRNTLI